MFEKIVKEFPPSLFASTMGTGILAITSKLYSEYWGPLGGLSLAVFWFNVVLFFILLIPWVLRWIMYRKEALRDFYHPIISNFYPTIAVGLLVISAGFFALIGNVTAGKVFWSIGTALTIFFGVVIPYNAFRSETIKCEHINPAWFIPPVALIVVPIAGSAVVKASSGGIVPWLEALNYFCWGAGFFIYLALLAVCIYRFILERPLPNVLVPTVWINLGPIGAGSMSLINLIGASSFVTVREPFFVFCLIMWGFGVWWFAIAALMTLHYIRRRDLPFAFSWWAFTFPLGAYVALCHRVGTIFGLAPVKAFGFVLYWLLVLFWVLALMGTVAHYVRTLKGGRK